MTDDIAVMTRVSPADLVNVFHERHRAEQPYTMCRDVCIFVNPYRWLSMYDQRARDRAALDASPPHVYVVTEATWRDLREQSQTIVITGESGAGKTEHARLCLEYIANRAAGDTNHRESFERLMQSGPILEYLGNAQTPRNGNSSRFGKFLCLDLRDGRLCGARVQTFLLERARIGAAARPREGAFRIFYAALEHAGDTHGLRAPDASVALNEPAAATPSSWAMFTEASDAVGLHPARIDATCRLVVAICFLLSRDFPSASRVLGIDVHVLARTLTHRRLRVVDSDDIWSECDPDDARTRIRAFARSIYQRLFDRTVADINYAARGDLGGSSLNVLDIFGFENFAHNTLDQLLINYCNERLQQLFVHDVITMQQVEYADEGIACETVECDSCERCVEVCEQTIFPWLDEALRTRTSARDAVNELRQYACVTVPRIRDDADAFVISHYAGPVAYEMTDFAERNADELRPELIDLMKETTIDAVDGVLSYARTATDARVHSRWTPSIAATFAEQMNTLCGAVSSTRVRYVRCIRTNESGAPDHFDIDVVREQIAAIGLSHACRVMRSGFDLRIAHPAVYRRLRRCFANRERRRALGLLRCAPGNTLASPCDASIGGVWGKSLLYVRFATLAELERHEAAFAVTGAVRQALRRMRAVKRVQRACRTHLFNRRVARRSQAREQTARQGRAACTIQTCVRAWHNRASNRFRCSTETERLREQVRILREQLRQKDEWIFRATQLLRQSLANQSTAKVEALLVLT